VLFPPSGAETALKAKLLGVPVEVGRGETLTLARNLAAAGFLAVLAAIGAWTLRRTTLGVVAIAAILPTALFSAYWLGSDPQFWLPVYAFVILLAAAGSRSRAPVLGAIAVLVALLFATNLAYGPPSPMHPSGDARWRTASALAPTLAPRTLLLRPGVTASPLEFVDDVRPDVEVLDLSYSPPRELRGDAVLAWIAERIESAASSGREVWFEGIAEPIPFPLLGSWTFTAGARGISREEVQGFLSSRYAIGPAAAQYPALTRVRAR
jgi:hypothetical protein